MSLGLIGTLEMAKRAMDTTRQGIELVGHNLSNVSNPAYARQRIKIQTGNSLPSPTGPTGTGAVVTGIEQIRSQLLDNQIKVESSLRGYLDAKQKALEFGEVNLGQQIDRQSSTPEAATAALGVGGQLGLVEGISDFFNSLQALSTTPNSTADRQVVMLKAENLVDKFNNVDARLARLRTNLNTSVNDDTIEANKLLKEISDLSQSITSGELGSTGSANDLKDRRQDKIEQLAKLTNLTTSITATINSFNLSISGVDFIVDNQQVDTLQTFADANGGFQVKGATGGALALTSGSMKGTIDARDGAVATLTGDVNNLAKVLITQVNTIHATGTALDGVSTGADFFTGGSAPNGTHAAAIKINAALLANPSLIQASLNGDPGDNGVALQLARLGNTQLPDLNNLTFAANYNQSVANFGQALNNVNSQIQDQDAVNHMLTRQRDSLGGVSIDEEMANLVVFQRAFEASAKMIATIDQLLQSVIALSR